MPTKAATGFSTEADTRTAVSNSLKQATTGLDGANPSLGVVFASPRHDLGGALAAAKQAVPGAEFVGCTTAGEITERTVSDLTGMLDAEDAIIDGGNTHYVADLRRAAVLAANGIHYVDVGVSGGVFGLERGFCLMVGAEDPVFARLEPIFISLAPGTEGIPRTRGRDGEPSPAERGYLHCGPVGAGHFVKMVHNGIEYGLMAAYAEGLNVLKHADVGTHARDADAETAPLEHPERYRFSLDVAEIAEVWRRGSVVSSWLLDLTAAALHDSPRLEGFAGRVSDSGEGRWTSIAAIEEGVPTPTLAAALFSRFDSRDEADFANRVLSAMRKEFGGHAEKPT